MPRLSFAYACSLFSFLLLAACGSGADASSDWQGTIRDSAGVTIVENRDAPLWDEDDGWTFTKLVRVGEAEGDPEYLFGALSGLLVMSDGRFAVGDWHSHNVRFFSHEGEFLFAVGRKGTGPGEFAGGPGLYLGPGDTILAIDGPSRRANIIGPDGSWLGSFPTTARGGYSTRSWDDDGTSGLIASMHRPLAGEAAPADADYSLIIRRDLHGAHLDTLARLPAQHKVTESGDTQLYHFYRGAGEYDLCFGSLITGHSDNWRFVWKTLDGRIERIATLDRPRLPITAEDRRLFFDSVDADFAEDGHLGEAAAYKSRVRFEDTYPAWKRFVCGPEGSILVQRVLTVSESYPEVNTGLGLPLGGEWDAFDKEGRYLGLVSLPAEPHRHAFARLAAGDWVMIGVETDEMDIEYVGVWKVEGIGDR
jgi:hypothetical protein